MKVQYDLEGGQLKRFRLCSKLALGAVLLVGLLLGSAVGSILFQRYWEEQRHVVPELPSTSTVAPVEVDIEELAYFEVNLDEHGLSVNVNQDNGSALSITEGSSDLLKEFAGLVLNEAFAAIRGLQEASNVKRVDIPELPSEEASTEEIWSWSTHEGHDGFRIRFDNGEWEFEAVNREESDERASTTEQSSIKEEEEGVQVSSYTETPAEEIWSWSSQSYDGFRIHYDDGKWSFETIFHETAEESDSDKER